MSIENLERPVAAAELMNGNNFWLRLKPVVNTPRNMLAIEYTVNSGGGARGKRPELFVILNISKDRDCLNHLNGQVLSSPLVQTAPVHESVLKNILALAKKGDRKLVDIGNGLILGQMGLIKTAFPDIFSSEQSNQQHTPQTDKDDIMLNSATTITWENLFRNISEIIENKAPNPIRLENAPKNGLSVLAINVKGASPVARFKINFPAFRSIQKQLEDRITKLQPGEYIRVEFLQANENIFVGDMQALLKLRALASQPPTIPPDVQRSPITHQSPQPVIARKAEAPAVVPVSVIPASKASTLPQAEAIVTPTTSAEAVTESSTQNPITRNEQVKSDEIVDMSESLSSVINKTFTWDELRAHSLKIERFLSQTSGYCFITYRSGIVGIVVSNTLTGKHGNSEIKIIAYTPVDIGQKDKNAPQTLADGHAIAYTKSQNTTFTIYSPRCVPQGIASHIFNKDFLPKAVEDATDGEKVSQAAEVGEGSSGEEARLASGSAQEHLEVNAEPKVPATSLAPEMLKVDFEVVSGQVIAVPDDLAQRISQRKGENIILERIQEVQKTLSNKNMLTTIIWNGTKLELTSNPVLLANTPALADLFKLQVEQAEITDDVSWIAAFEKAVSFNGLVVLEPTGEQPSVLITKKPDFFINVIRELC